MKRNTLDGVREPGGSQFFVDDVDPADVEVPLPRPVRTISMVLGIIAGSCVMALMLLTVVDVVKRKYFGGGLLFASELTEVALPAVAFAGMMSAEVLRVHVRTPLLIDHVHGRWRPLLQLIGLTASVAVAGWLTWVTARAGIASYQSGEYRFGLTRIPLWWAKIMIPIGSAGFTLVLLFEWIGAARRFAVQPASAESATQSERDRRSAGPDASR